MNCADCRFGTDGICHRYPAEKQTMLDYWCGEWRGKELCPDQADTEARLLFSKWMIHQREFSVRLSYRTRHVLANNGLMQSNDKINTTAILAKQRKDRIYLMALKNFGEGSLWEVCCALACDGATMRDAG